MTLARAIQKIFCKDANDVTRFGTNLTTPVYTKDLYTIQSAPAWTTGLVAAVDSAKRAFLSDMNAIFYVITYQLAYIFQQGIPEYGEYTEYFIGSIVQHNGKIYRSLKSYSVAWPVTNPTAWELIGDATTAKFMALKAKATAGEVLRAVTSWTSVSVSNKQWQAVVWSRDQRKFVAISNTTNTAAAGYSTDGITWNTSSTGLSNTTWQSICWSPERSLYCAVATNPSGTRAGSSPDGVTWTSRATPVCDFRSVCWSAELGVFCAVASGTVGSTTLAMTSPDGATWTARTTPVNGYWYSVCWAAELGLFVAVGGGAGLNVITSPDGITWTARSVPTSLTWRSVCWSPELRLLVAVAITGTGNRVMTSPDGVNWTTRASAADNSWVSVCWASELGVFCAVSSDGTSRVMTSQDGVNWVSRTATDTGNGVCWSPELGQFCVASTSSVKLSRFVKRFWR